jgi:hypothetical protein
VGSKVGPVPAAPAGLGTLVVEPGLVHDGARLWWEVGGALATDKRSGVGKGCVNGGGGELR